MISPFNEEYEKDADIKPVTPSWPYELISALKESAIEDIKYYQLEMGFYIGLKERATSPKMKANIDLIIIMTRYKIEENYDDVEKYRKWEKELIPV